MQGQDAAVRIDRVGDVMVLVLTHPPVNALSDAVRGALQAGLRAGLADPEVTAIVLRGEGRGFSAGADISEFGKPRQTARLGDLCLEIENAGKPVIAAIHGMALGGGLELALAAHYRIANAQAMLGLPEVNLGLLPGAGGTQRLPRLVGARAALRVMLTGVPIAASEAMALGLVDRVVEAGLTEAAIAMAGEGLAPRPTGAARQGMTDMVGYLGAVSAARAAQKGNRLPAAARIVDCVEAAALFPLQQGLYAEEAAFAELVATPEAAGLRYAFFTERRAMMPPQLVAAKGAVPITTVGIWGVDDSAADLAFQALSAGMRVVFASADRAALVTALERMAARQEQAVVAGQLTEDARDADWARLTTSMSVEPLKTVDLVLTVAGTAALTQGQVDVAQASLGPAQAQGGLDVGLTVPFAAGGLAEVSMSQSATAEAVARVLALARRVNWRVVFTGPDGPVELGLRQALAEAVADLTAQGEGEAVVTAALAAYGMATGARAARPAMPRGGGVIVAACLAAMAAEGARMLVDGRARRPLEIDAVAMLSGLMPRWEGGPMFQADQRGLLVVRQELITRAGRSAVFQVPVLIDDLIADGTTFASLNG